jgi:hypothetical protein
VNKPRPIAEVAAPILIRLALAEIDTAIDRMCAARKLLAQQFAPPERDIQPAHEPGKTEQ